MKSKANRFKLFLFFICLGFWCLINPKFGKELILYWGNWKNKVFSDDVDNKHK